MKPILAALLCAVSAAQAVELIADGSFQRGLTVKDRAGNKQVISWGTNAAAPVWSAAQHYSQSSFADKAHQTFPANGFAFQDDYEMLRIHPADEPADFICGVNGAHEFGGRLRAQGDPWPHLYLEQRISSPGGQLGAAAPSLAALEKLNFAVRIKLLHDRRQRGATYSRTRHAAQFQLFFTVQNLNPKSKGYGDYYWFGVSLYDDRAPVTALHAMQDKGSEKKEGTDKLIYDVGVKPFTDQVVAAGAWVPVAGDLLPHILAGLQEAWRQGYLADSRDLCDYRLGSLVIGWEVTGLNDVAMAVQGLTAEATLKK